MKPPGRTEFETRIMACEGGELARVAAFVEREDNQTKARVVTERIEERLQGADVIGAGGNIGALVAAVIVEQPLVMVAERTGMDLHHQSVLYAYASHFGQHLGSEKLGVGGLDLATG